jgi:regulator of Ty1 transposition protein 109
MPAELSSLQTRLAAVLPVGVNVKTYHLSTPPTASSALFAPSPGQEDQNQTCCESHFLAVASPEDGDDKEVLVFAVEILIFTTGTLTTLFVSKADSSGFSSRLNAPKGSPSTISAVISTFVDFLLEPRLTNSRVVLSLFARSQHQYLFPGSVENTAKHVLDDRQLIKWWCRVLDKVLRHDSSPSLKSTAHLVVPGCDKGETKAFFPPSSRHDPPSDPKWINSYPAELLVTDPSRPPRSLVPRFPDDPKARFLDDLDGDFVDAHGNWRSVKNLDQFWEMMSYRQECSAGRLVGFLWMVFSQGQTSHASLKELEQELDQNSGRLPPQSPGMLTPASSQQVPNGALRSEGRLLPSPPGLSRDLDSPPPSSPLEMIQPEGLDTVIAAADADLPVTVITPAEQDHKPVQLFERTQGEILLDADQYQTLMDFLLQTDFAGDDLAAQSTGGWVQKAMELSAAPTLGLAVRGQQVAAQTNGAESQSLPQVNVLTGVRKKRKADVLGDQAAAAVPTVNALSAALVRKRPKS